MHLVCLDLESVLIPEIWVTIAKVTKVRELQLTTRDVPDYKELMKRRLQLLSTHNLTLANVQKIIETINPLDGALSFLNWSRKHFPTIILTGSFYEFIAPLMDKLAYPTLFGNSLEIDHQGFISNYRLRQQNGKIDAVKALKTMGFQTIAVGDSYNDLGMLREADIGFLFNPTENIRKEFPDFSVVDGYDDLKYQLSKYSIPGVR